MATYTLPSGVRSGRVTYRDGTRVWLEYADSVWNNAVSDLDYLKRALERTVTEACVGQSCNWAQIMSIFHSTTRRDDGTKVLDKYGLHVTVMMTHEENGKRQSPEKAHVYIEGFNKKAAAEHWYDNVRVKWVRWESDRTGSSQGSGSSQGGGSPFARSTSTTPKKSASPPESKAASPARGQGATPKDGWYPDPRKQAKERYFKDGSWTSHVRN